MDHVHAHSILRGTLEVPVQEALRRTLGPGAVFYDVGANIGFFSLLAARFVGPTGRVIALEPVPESAASIRANAAANSFDWIEVHQLAAAAESGLAEFCVVADASWSRLMRYGLHSRTERKLEVEGTTLDELIQDRLLPIPDVIKIDVEGAELEVLEGMSRTMQSHQPTIICELHVTNEAFITFTRDHGYSAENLDGSGSIACAGPNIHVIARAANRSRVIARAGRID